MLQLARIDSSVSKLFLYTYFHVGGCGCVYSTTNCLSATCQVVNSVNSQRSQTVEWRIWWLSITTCARGPTVMKWNEWNTLNEKHLHQTSYSMLRMTRLHDMFMSKRYGYQIQPVYIDMLLPNFWRKSFSRSKRALCLSLKPRSMRSFEGTTTFFSHVRDGVGILATHVNLIHRMSARIRQHFLLTENEVQIWMPSHVELHTCNTFNVHAAIQFGKSNIPLESFQLECSAGRRHVSKSC